MAGELTVQVEGLRELERAWLQLSNDLGPARARTTANIPLRNAMRPVLAAIQANTPEDTGELRASARINFGRATRGEVSRGTLTRNDVAVARAGWFWRGRSLWFRALAVEYGTRLRAPGNVLRSALESRINSTVNILAQELGRRIEQRAARLARRR